MLGRREARGPPQPRRSLDELQEKAKRYVLYLRYLIEQRMIEHAIESFHRWMRIFCRPDALQVVELGSRPSDLCFLVDRTSVRSVRSWVSQPGVS